MKNGEKLKNNLKVLLIAILILPIVMCFAGCSCSKDNGNNSNASKVEYTIIFYTGNPEKFNIEKQIVKEGELITEPDTTGWYYYDEVTKKTKTFGNWYSDQSLDLKYVWKFQTDRVYNNMTLYAKWNDMPD